MYANPRTTQVDCDLVAQHDPEYLSEWLQLDQNARRDKEQVQIHDYDDTLAWFNTIHPQRGDFLEVGSSLGYMLQHFHADGWQVLGIEPDVLCARHANELLKMPTIPQILPLANLPASSRDAVLMSHVIEHVPDPADTLRDLHRVLRPQGVLVMETPRYDSLMFRILGRRERSLACDGHIWFFTTRTLRELAQRNGFEVIKLDLTGRSMTLERFLWNVGVVTKHKGFRDWLDRLSTRWQLKRLRLRLNFRDMQRIYLRRVDAMPPKA